MSSSTSSDPSRRRRGRVAGFTPAEVIVRIANGDSLDNMGLDDQALALLFGAAFNGQGPKSNWLTIAVQQIHCVGEGLVAQSLSPGDASHRVRVTVEGQSSVVTITRRNSTSPITIEASRF